MKLNAFLRDESGATAVEYGLIAALVSSAIIVSLTAFGDSLNGILDAITDAINNV